MAIAQPGRTRSLAFLLSFACSLSLIAADVPVCYLTTTNAIVSDRKVPCGFRVDFHDPSLPGNTNLMAGVVRIHGGVSQGYAKKSYGLTLEGPLSFPGMRASPHWVLNAAYIDRSLMRHKLAYDLFLSLNQPDARRYAAASRFVELNLNGKYNGVYLLMERVDSRLLSLHAYNSNDTTHACIYKAVDHSANFARPGHWGYEQREPDPLTAPYWGPLDRFDAFVSAKADSDFFNPEKGIGARLDLANAIDFHLLVLLTCNLDGIDKNFMIARDWQTSTNKPPFFFIPWDYDGTFGRNWNAARVGSTSWLSNHLFDRLLGDAQYAKQFGQRWKQLRDGPFSSKTIAAMMDANVQTLGAAVQRNFKRWPVTQGPYPDQVEFAEDISQMKEWLDQRIKWLDGEIGRRSTPH